MVASFFVHLVGAILLGCGLAARHIPIADRCALAVLAGAFLMNLASYRLGRLERDLDTTEKPR